jgi:hypothetical protein
LIGIQVFVGLGASIVASSSMLMNRPPLCMIMSLAMGLSSLSMVLVVMSSIRGFDLGRTLGR